MPGAGPHACIVRQCGRSPMSLAASAGNNFSRIATTTRFCPGRPWAPREQLRRRARWMQRRKSGPDCLSAASFRAVRRASYGPLTLLRVVPTACPDKAGFNEPVPLFTQNPWFVIFTCDCPEGSAQWICSISPHPGAARMSNVPALVPDDGACLDMGKNPTILAPKLHKKDGR
jgi:hypothetical protein